MRLRMLAAPVTRVMEDRGGRPGAAERLVIADIDPEPSGVGLAFCQHGHGRVVAVQALGRHDMGLEQAPERIERPQMAPTASAMVDSAIGTPSSA